MIFILYLQHLKSHDANLLNVKFPLNNKFLDKIRPVEGLPVYITKGRVSNVIKKRGFRKITQLSGVVIAIVIAGRNTITLEPTHLPNAIIRAERMQDGWNLSSIIANLKTFWLSKESGKTLMNRKRSSREADTARTCAIR